MKGDKVTYIKKVCPLNMHKIKQVNKALRKIDPIRGFRSTMLVVVERNIRDLRRAAN